MTLSQLRYIVAVDLHRHFGKAAEHCFVTQPALSIQIRKLEGELGLTLFDRSQSPVIPTDIGARFIEQARVILQEVNRLKDNLDSWRSDFTSDAIKSRFSSLKGDD